MRIEIKQSKIVAQEYITFLKETYSHETVFPVFMHDLNQALAFVAQSESISITYFIANENSKFVGQIALIENAKLPKGTAFFGFFECVKNNKVFTLLWEELKVVAKQKLIQKLTGPINASTWFSNRVITKKLQEPYFFSEFMSQEFYATFFQNQMPANTIEYHSAFRQKIDVITELTKPAYDALANTDIVITQVENITEELMHEVFSISEDVFSTNPGYVPINFNEFKQLYSSEKLNDKTAKVYVVTKRNKLIGYSINLVFGEQLIMKTICLLPQFQDKGIGNAMVYYVHKDARKNKVKQVIYALVRKDNKVKRFPTDDVEVMREYALYEFEL